MGIRHRHRRFSGNGRQKDERTVSIWMLRLLTQNNWMFKAIFHPEKGYADDDVQEFLGLPEYDSDKKITYKKVRNFMVDKLERLESKKISDKAIDFNINLLAERIELTEVQKSLLTFAVLTDNSSAWSDMFRFVKIENEQEFLNVLSCALDVGLREIKKEVSKKSFLRQSGLISLNKDYYTEAKFDIMSSLEEALLADNTNQEELLAHFLMPTKKSNLTMKDYPHAMDDIQVVSEVLSKAINRKDMGVNILLYGIPGTGKTELVRLLAETLKLSLYEVKTEDDDGGAINASRRLGSYRLSQQLLAEDKNSLLLFDEVEDVFPARAFSFFGMEMKSGENKGWMNKTLEENTTPAIWVCNQVRQIDAAFLRRFDYVMELNTPPKSVRLNIIKSYLSDERVSEAFKNRLADHSQLSPAQVAKLSKVASRLGQSSESIDEVLEKVLENSLKAMSLKPLPKKSKHETKYDLSFINTHADIQSMIKGLGRSKKGNLCFYGAPGTGKTALAGYIAETLEMPLVSKKASDILGMYVGQSEQNIAAMFREATREKAVLVLDEADSLLRDRRSANQSWEVTQVNELLVQMENFEGIFICSTNLMDNLDQASLRRFALKIEFKYLSPEQALRMLEQESLEAVDSDSKRKILAMNNLAPGDFSAVKKRLNILDLDASAKNWVAELKEEVTTKEPHAQKPIGFM
ncbi:ATP-binding protein [Ghiorsea bivora]|uniref:ATP-binding protein n=1 Tax=Ghiorsea bivora TaxID=1485545 RepID=UPI0005707F03|nr:ATP-binding protein [Ghiorsea bivora]